MSLVGADNLKLSYGDRAIFAGDSFQVGFRDRIGLIGPNGTGKTTLLRILAGKQSVDGGSLRIQRGVRIGYLPQDVLEMRPLPLLASVLESVPGKKAIEGEVAACEAALSQTDDPEEQMELAGRLADLHEAADHQETFFSEHEAERILTGLGFSPAEFDRSISELSGGWKMRAALAALLFQKPDLLLLDEPTNHLDLPSVRWIESFLSQFPHALLLISHDREFLDRQVTRILSIEPEGLRAYPGNFSRYRALREEEERVIEAAAKNQEQKRRELERFIIKYRANKPKARQAQSRIKLLRKMEEIEKLVKPQAIRKFTFPPVERAVRDVFAVRGIAKSFGDLRLFRDLSLTVHRGERIAVIGVNGAGKTTLLRIMAGELAPDAGEVRRGGRVQMGYYAQHQTEQLNLDATVLDEVWRVVPDRGQSFVRGVCGAFLFPGDDVDKRVGVLSGGEKARVSLARLLVRNYNLLLMDEPTNHLDLHSAEALAEALETYEGTLIFVSHNQAFVNRLATKVWNLEQGRIEEYPGNLTDYFYHLRQLEEARQREREGAAPKAKEPAPRSKPPGRLDKEYRKQQRRQEAERRREHNRRLSAARKKVKEMEARVAKLESRQSEVSALLTDPEVYRDGGRMKDLLAEFDRNKHKLEELVNRWEVGQERLEEIESQAPDPEGAAVD